jgi:16S rRNA processing protein RimM
MLTQDECFRLGHIARLHGFKGELTIFLDTEDPTEFKGLESVFVEYDKKLVPFFLERIQLRDRGHALVKFEDVDTEKGAKNLVGCPLYLPLDNLPQLEEDEFYHFELKDFKVIDETHGPIGNVVRIADHAGNPLIEINFNGKEILLPMQDQFIERIDKKEKTVYVKAPGGLIEMYLGEEE